MLLLGASDVLEGHFKVFTSMQGEISVEAVLAARPQAIIAGSDGGGRPAWLDEWRRWPTLPAVASGELHAVDADLLHRAGPRFIDGVESLCAVIDGVQSRAAAASAALAPR